MITPLDPTGKFRVRTSDKKKYLVSPIDGWGKTKPTWTDIPEAAFMFNESEACGQTNFLWWGWRISATYYKPRRKSSATIQSSTDNTGETE